MKKINMNEIARYLKTTLKHKVSINRKTVITFLMAGFMGLSTVSYAGWDWVWSVSETGETGWNGTNGWARGEQIGRGNVILARYDTNKSTKRSVVIGTDNATANGNEAVVLVGAGTLATGAQATALGNETAAGAQATAIGSDVTAAGFSSIAIGSDDIYENGKGFKDKLPEATISKIYRDGESSTTATGGSLSWDTFKQKYVRDTSQNVDQRVYSPTYAKSTGSIAIGSRSVAYGKGATTLGTLSFALADNSTAIGLRTYADFTATGATAIGEETRVFAPDTIAIGNHSEATNKGSLSFGNKSKAVGLGSVSIGENVITNAKLNDANYRDFKTKLEEAANINGDPKVGDSNPIVDSAFGSSNGTQPEDKKKIVSTSINNKFNNFEFNVEKEKDVIITTTEEVKKTKKDGDYGVSLGYYVYNRGDNSVGIGTATGVLANNAVGIGALAYVADKANNSVAIGVGSNVRKENSVSIGTATSVLGAGSVGLGIGALVARDNSVSIGYGVNNKSAASIAIGNGVKLEYPNDEIFELGHNSYVPAKYKDAYQIGIGNNSKVSVVRGIAIGDGAESTTLANSVALGYKSKVDYTIEELNKPGYTARGSYSVPSSSRVGVISVGSQGNERRIINVASGYRDSDVVTVSQLKTIEDRIDGISESEDDSIRYFSINQNNGDTKELTELGKREINYKNYVKYLKQKLVVKARKADGETINEQEASLVEMEEKLKKLVDKNDIKNKPENIINLIKEVYNTTDLKNLSDFDKKTTKYWTDVQENGQTRKVFNLALFLKDLEDAKRKDEEALAREDFLYTTDEKQKLKESNFTNKGANGEDSLAIGFKAETLDTAKNSVAIGTSAKVTTEGSVAIGANSLTTATADTLAKQGYDPQKATNKTGNEWIPNAGEFAVGNGATKTRRITGVAAGLNDTDAVNVAQLKRVLSGSNLKYKGNEDRTTGVANETLASDAVLSVVGEGAVSTKAEASKITISLNADKVKELTGTTNLATEYAKADASNITSDDNKNKWREKLSVYTKGETNKEIAKAKEVVEGTTDEIDVQEGTQNTAKKFTVKLSKTIKDKIDAAKTGVDTLNSKSLTFKDGAGTTYIRNNNADGTVTIKEANIDTDYKAENLKVKLSATGEYSIGLKSALTGITSIASNNNADATKLSLGDGVVTLSKGTNEKVTLTGLKDGVNESDAVTKGQLDKVAEKLGDTAKDGNDARNGNDGPAGKDGLNGLNVNEKVNALRRGEAGSVVYTNENGDRVVKGEDGNYYKLDDIKEKVYVSEAGKQGYYDKTEVDKNKDGSYKVKDGTTPTKVAELSANDKAKIRLSLVAEDGTTTTPEILSNVASILETGKLTTNTVITSADAKTIVSGANGLNSISDNKKLNTVATVGDLQALSIAGLEFIGNTGGTDAQATDKKTHQSLGTSISIVGSDLTGTSTFDKDYSIANVATKVSANKIEIGILKTPRFDALELGNNTNKIKLTPDADANTLTLSKNGTDKVELKGLKEGTSDDSAVTKGQLDKLAQKAGDTSTDKTDKRNGEDGKVGPAGKDGLNGLSVNEKVNALRRGEAGSVVYTNENGDRVVKGEDGNYYKLDDIKDKVYISENGKEGYYNSADLTKNPNGTYSITAGSNPTKADKLSDDEKGKIRLSLVADNGETTTPEILSNVASVLGTGTGNTVITVDNAKNLVSGNNGLNTIADNKKLNTVATVGDLQALSIAGLEFTGNTGGTDAGKTDKKTHQVLGSSISIVGKDGVNSFDNYSTANVATKVSAGKIEIGILKTPKFEALELGNDTNKIKLTPDADGNTLTLSKNDGNDKVELKGLKEGTSEDSAVTKGQLDKLIKKSGDTSADKSDARNGNDGPAGKDGLNGLSVNDKVNALRRGEAGTVVYTNENGDRIVRGLDGKYYKQADIKDKVYINTTGKEGYYTLEKDNMTENPDGTYKVADNHNLTGNKVTELTADDKAKIRLSLVADNGETTTPEILSNVASSLGTGTGAGTTVITSTDAIEKINGTTGLNKITENSKLNTVATVGDLQALSIAGLDFIGNTGGTDTAKTDKKTHQVLGSSISIVGSDLETNKTFDNDYSTSNVATKVSAGKIEIGILKTPRFDALELGDNTNKIKLTPDATNGTLTLSKNGTENVELKGLKEGTSSDSAVTKGQLDKLAQKAGDTSTDKTDKRNGENGKEGPAGKDGLNGLSVNEKVNALRRGEAGSVVYTNENGDRIVKGRDGKYYKQADIKDKVYVNTAGKEGYYTLDTNKMTDNGDGTYALKDSGTFTDTPATALNDDEKSKIRLSLVADDGTTTTPEILSNVASGIGTSNEVATNYNDKDKAKKDKAIEDAKAINTSLLGLTNANSLNTAATLGDLQAISITGLNFVGNDANTTIHKPLGDKLTIKGGLTEASKVSATNTYVAVENDELIVKFAKKPILEGIELRKDETKDTGGKTITINNNGDVIISHEETQGGNKTIVEEKILTDKNVGDGAKLKYKENGKTAKEVSLTEGLNFVNTTNITASIDENGVVKHTLNENLKAIKSISSTDDETGTKITLGDGVVTLSKGTNEKVTLTGLKDGVNESDAVTKGQLDKLAEKLGETSTDKTDGRNGENGKVGLAGKDGLNGLNVNEKVNALRRGEAGSVVYTDEDGNRLVKAKDGNFYKNSEVNKDGYLKFEKDGITYIKVNDQIYKETDVEKGTPKPNAEAVAEDIKAEINKITAADNVGLSLVNENGETTKPEILRNVESTLGTGKLTTNTVITPDDAKVKISGENGLNSISDNKKLNTAATVGDLQALSIAGLDFTGNDNENVHRNLGTKLKLVGEGTSTITKTAKDNIKVEANTAKDGLEVKLSAELKNMTSFETNDLSDDPNSTVTEKIKLDKDGLKTTKKNQDNTLTESNVSAEGTTIVKGTPDNTGAITPTEKADYRLDRAELVDKDQNSALLTPKSLSFGTDKADADNKTATTIDRNGLSISTENGKPDIELKAGKDDKGKAITPTLAFAKDDAGNGTGVISGLKDVDENSTDGSQAVNKNYVDAKLNNTMDTIEATMKELTGGIAGAYAAAGIPQVSADKLFGVGLGFGHFKGESAVAVGISGQNKNRNVVYKASVSFGTKSELGVSAGVNISLGQINDENKSTLSKDVMARLSQLEEENARLKEKVNSNRRLRYVIDNFVLDSDKITKQQSAKLKEIVKVVNKEFKDKTIVIIGYADIRYKEEYNLNLGMKRARAARNALIKLGISDDVNIVIKSAGYNERVEGNYSNQRRVEILINEYDSINSK